MLCSLVMPLSLPTSPYSLSRSEGGPSLSSKLCSSSEKDMGGSDMLDSVAGKRTSRKLWMNSANVYCGEEGQRRWADLAVSQ